MVKEVNRGLFIYKKYGKDIWSVGVLGVRISNFRIFRRSTKLFYKSFKKARRQWMKAKVRHTYRLDILNIRPKRRRIKKKFASIRFIKWFYLILSYKQFKSMARQARKKDGYFEGNYCLLLEGRLVSVIYRSGFVGSMFDSLNNVRKGYIVLERKIASHPNKKVSLYNMVSFHPWVKRKAFWDLFVRVVGDRRCLFNGVAYMFISFWFLFVFMVRLPFRKDLAMPKFIDIYRATGYAS